jgi:hypothetical protein
MPAHRGPQAVILSTSTSGLYVCFQQAGDIRRFANSVQGQTQTATWRAIHLYDSAQTGKWNQTE